MEEEEVLIKLAEAIDEESVIEYTFVDVDETIMQVMYHNWDSKELCALVDNNFNLIIKGIINCEYYNEEFRHFMIYIDSEYFNQNIVAANSLIDQYFTVIGFRGEILIDFQRGYIGWDDDEKSYVNEFGRLIKAEGLKEIRY